MSQDNRIQYGPKNVAFIDSDVGIGCIAGVGAVPTALAAYVTADEFGDGKNHRTVLTCTDLEVATVDNGTAGHGGGTKIYDFPKGLIATGPGIIKADSIVVDGTGLPNDAAFVLSVGSVVATSVVVTLTGTMADIIDQLSLTLSTSVSCVNNNSSVLGLSIIDGSGTAVDAYLNVSGTAGSLDADGTLTFTGKIEINWTNLGYSGE
ncbi:MAG: hypothetical protein WC683_06700 [bacterium]